LGHREDSSTRKPALPTPGCGDRFAAKEGRAMPMPKIIQISHDPPGPGRSYIGVDNDGDVWRGIIKGRAPEEYIEWKRIRSEFK